MERPALKALLAHVKEKRTIDVVVVYKVDRLTRSLADSPRGNSSKSSMPKGSRSSRSRNSSIPLRQWAD